MADITEQHDQTSPNELEDQQGNGAAESRGVKRQRQTAPDDDDDDDDKGGRERRKIEIKFISDKSRRHITFSKRKAGIMKKVSRRDFLSQQHPLLLSNNMRPSATAFPLLFLSTSHCTATGVPTVILIILAASRATPLTCQMSGLRAIRPHRHTGLTSGGLGDRSCVHIHHAKAPTSCDQGRGQESDSGMCLVAYLFAPCAIALELQADHESFRHA